MGIFKSTGKIPLQSPSPPMRQGERVLFEVFRAKSPHRGGRGGKKGAAVQGKEQRIEQSLRVKRERASLSQQKEMPSPPPTTG